MIVDHLFYDTKEYPYAMVKIFGDTEKQEYINVSTTQLESVLLDPKTYIPVCDEAERLDNKLDFYLDEGELLSLPEDEVVHLIELNF